MNKFFTEKQIYVATVFGGPIPPGILIYKNFKRVGDDKKALWTFIITTLFTASIFYGLMQLPDSITDKIPNIAFTSLYTIIVYIVYHKYLASLINDKIIEKENKASNWSVAGITVLGLIINLLIIMLLAYAQPTFPGEKFLYGELKHEIFYDKSDFNEAQIKSIGDVLAESGYFNNEFRQSVRIEIIDKKTQLLLPLQKDVWDNQDINNEIIELKKVLAIIINQDIDILLIHYELSGKTITRKM